MNQPIVASGPAPGPALTPGPALASRPRPTFVIPLMSAAALVCFGIVGLWAGHSRGASVSQGAVVVEGAAARVVVHPGDVVAAPPASPGAVPGAALPGGWPIELLPSGFVVRSTGAVGDLLVVTGTLPRAAVDPWTSSLVGVWGVTGRSAATNDAGTAVERLALRGGGVISVQEGDPAVVEIMLKS